MNKIIIPFIALSLGTSLLAEDFPGADDDFSKTISESEQSSIEKDDLKIGGNLNAEFQYYNRDQSLGDGAFSNPNRLAVYLDSRKVNDLRLYAKGTYLFNPTLTTTQKEDFYLEEAKLMFHLKRLTFMTVGRQKVKWGVGTFWNPTDFMNELHRDPLRSEDQRIGVSMIKAHIPINDSNLYFIAGIDEAKKVKQITSAARFEIPFKSSELSFSVAHKDGTDTKYGIDASTAVWDFDLYAEAAFSQTKSLTVGASYSVNYSDEDSVTFIPEYYYKGDGRTDVGNYGALAVTGLFVPFNTSRHYVMFAISLPNPGKWNNVSFTLFNVANIVDNSFISKAEATVTSIQDLSIITSVGYHYGNQNGEFRFGNQLLDLALQLKINF